MFLVSGAGISGLLFATLLLNERICSPNQIVIVESANSCGGLYNPWFCPNLGELDKGMHIYYETLIEEIDSIIFNSIPEKDWFILEGNFKDVAGAYYNGRLQTNSPYPDLRFLEKKYRDECITEILNNLNYIKKNKMEELITNGYNQFSAKDYWTSRFGSSIYQKIFNPICKKLYGAFGDELSPNVAYYTKLDRVIIFSSELMQEIGNSNFLRKVLAFPDQLNMPNYRSNSQRGLYPKLGMRRVVESLNQNLLDTGVKFLMNSTVRNIEYLKGKYRVKISNNSGEFLELFPTNIFWSGSRSSLANAMKIKSKNISQKGESNYIFCRVDEENLSLPDLYYFYCLDDKYSAFRVTNISQYTNNIDSKGRKLICIEQHSSTEESNNHRNIDDCAGQVINELLEMKVLTRKPKSNMVRSFQIRKRIFPRPLLLEDELCCNMQRIDNLPNIIFPGKNKPLSKSPFFLVDALKDIYSQFQQSLR